MFRFKFIRKLDSRSQGNGKNYSFDFAQDDVTLSGAEVSSTLKFINIHLRNIMIFIFKL
jgi:hypothetical protein